MPTSRVRVLPVFTVPHRPLTLGALLAKRVRHLATFHTPLRANAETRAKDINKRVLDEKHCRRFVPASLSAKNLSRSHQEDVPASPYLDVVASRCARTSVNLVVMEHVGHAHQP